MGAINLSKKVSREDLVAKMAKYLRNVWHAMSQGVRSRPPRVALHPRTDD